MDQVKLSIDEIFLTALEKPTPEERSGFLDAACGSDAELRHRVERLLKAHPQVAAFLEVPAPGVERVAVEPIAESPGTLVGRYKLLELIGEGGFGSVFMAEQQEPVRRQVALKIIKLGMDTKQVVARFEAERQALAMMDHGNIAKVLDAGATETGRPYFMMELVRGEAITEYCDANRLTTRDRLKLFVDVCHAVQHAHQKGIIHRDIKPTNVMVTRVDGEPLPKVIDFGIAKATQQRLTEKTLYTSYRQLIGTPQYMSPEQAAMGDRDVDTRSDIYSLGVLLYELLVGTTPFNSEELQNSGYDKMCRIISETDPPTPSRRLSTLGAAIAMVSEQRQVMPNVLSRQLRGDLDWIVMKALEKDRSRRYATANNLALDIERHLANEPVRARPPSILYRLRKFVRKYRGPVAAAMAVVASLVLGLVLAIAGFVRARHEQQVRTRQLYISDVNSAYHAWDNGNIDRAVELLNRHAQQRDDETRCGFEWHLLRGRLQRAIERPCLQHEDLSSIAFSPDGALLASASHQGSVKLWDMATRDERCVLDRAHDGNAVLCLAFSPDGTLFATGGSDHTAKLWDVATCTLQRTLPLDQPVASVLFSPNGQTLYTGQGTRSSPGDIQLWDVASGTALVTLQGHDAEVVDLAFSPDGTLFASASTDRTVKLWDTRTRLVLATLRGHTNRVTAVEMSPDGRTLASAGMDGAVKLWDLPHVSEGRKKIARRELQPSNRSAGTPPHGASRRPPVTMRDQFPQHVCQVYSLAFSTDSNSLAIGSQDGRVWLWNPTTRKVRAIVTGHTERVDSLAFSPDGKMLATGSVDGTIRLLQDATFPAQEIDSVHSDWLSHIAVGSSDANMLALGIGELTKQSQSGEVVLWDLSMRKSRILFSSPDRPVRSVALSASGGILAAGTGGHQGGDEGCEVMLWDLPSGKRIRTVTGHTASISALAFSPDERTLASADWGRPDANEPDSADWHSTIFLSDMATGELRHTFRVHRFRPVSIVFSPNGRWLVAGGGLWEAGSIKRWDVASGKQLSTLTTEGGLIGRVAFSPDGMMLAAPDWKGRLNLWDLANGEQYRAIRAHSHHSMGLAFAPDGKTLATGSFDQTVKLWHVPSGEQLAVLHVHAPVMSVAFLRGGRTLAAACSDKTLCLWHADAQEEVLRYRADDGERTSDERTSQSEPPKSGSEARAMH